MRNKEQISIIRKKPQQKHKNKTTKKACIYCYRTQLINSICDLTDAVSQFLRLYNYLCAIQRKKCIKFDIYYI